MLELVFDGKLFRLKCHYSEREIARVNGFRWRDDLKGWYTTSLAVAVKLCKYADESAKRRLEKVLIHELPWPSPLPLPPDGLALLPHQTEALRFALTRNKCYLGLDPGLGKTIVAAMVARALGQPVIYISPPFLVRNVEEEFAKWAPGIHAVVIPDTQLDLLDMFWAGYSKTLFIDEAHRFKNLDAQRTQTLLGKRSGLGMVDHFSHVILMSGTPMPNRPYELYPVLSKMAPGTIDFMSAFDYGLKYCAGFDSGWGWDFTGASNLPELRRRVIYPEGPFMLRMKKDLLDLPPKIEEIFVVSDDMSPQLAKMDRDLSSTYDSVEELIKHRIAKAAGKSEDELPVATYRRLLGMEKVRAAVEYIDMILEGEEHLIVFAYHKDVIAELAAKLETHHPLVITGNVPDHKRLAIVKEFQNGTKHKLLVANYATMIGYTITRATRGLFVEFDWVPGVNDQAGDRMHRIGQKGTVLIQFAVMKNSLDKKILGVLLKKRNSLKHI